MTAARIALTLLGVVLLVPGLCGGIFAGAMVHDHWQRASVSFFNHSDVVWFIAVPSLNIGAAGLLILYRQYPTRWLFQAMRLAGIAGLIATLCVLGLVLLQGERRPGDAWLLVASALASFLVFALPALLASRAGNRQAV